MIVMKIDSQAVRPFSVLSKLEPLEEKTWGIVSRLINRMKNSPVDYTAAP
jgi:Txe/YoeB family toxin of Txe-Axe toxin-antitoxin module